MKFQVARHANVKSRVEPKALCTVIAAEDANVSISIAIWTTTYAYDDASVEERGRRKRFSLPQSSASPSIQKRLRIGACIREFE